MVLQSRWMGEMMKCKYCGSEQLERRRLPRTDKVDEHCMRCNRWMSL